MLSGGDCRFVIGFTSTLNSLTRALEVSLLINNSDGLRLTNLSTHYFGDTLWSELPEQGAFECVIPELPLHVGRYVVDLYCSVDGQLSEQVYSGAEFFVVDGDFFGTGRLTSGSRGSVFMQHRWQLCPTLHADTAPMLRTQVRGSE